MDTQVMFQIEYGLFVLTAREDGKDNGCIINTLQQVTDSPLRVSITVNKRNYTHDMILRTGVFNVSILSQKASFDTFRHFGFQSGRDTDKMKDYMGLRRSSNGVMYLESSDTNAYLSAKVFETIELGTHTMFLADVTAVQVSGEYMDAGGRFCLSQAHPLVYSHGEYYGMGKWRGKFGYSVKKRKKARKQIR